MHDSAPSRHGECSATLPVARRHVHGGPAASTSQYQYTLSLLKEPPGFAAPAIPANFNPFRFCPPPRQTTPERPALIARAAYFRAEKRGFEAGHELEDWLAAEAEVDQQLADARWRNDGPLW
jgi:hypothetical protein